MNKLTTFLSSRSGKRLLNMAYSWGACLVILGATFKIIHYPYDDVFLIIGMTTEIIIFFISGFDEPAREFKWTRVFPQLDSRHTAEPAHQPAVQIEESMKRLNESIEKVSKEYVSQLEMLKAQTEALRKQAEQMQHAQQAYREVNDKIEAIDRQYTRIMEVMNIQKN